MVNVAALREAEQRRFTDAYFRFVAQRDLVATQVKDDLQNRLSPFARNASIRVQPEPFAARHESAVIAFSLAFREIRDAFVSSPHFGIKRALVAEFATES